MGLKTLQVGPLHTNCYLLIDEKTRQAAAVDVGESGDQVAALVREEGAALRYILCTHGHLDHVSGIPALAAAFPEAEIYIHERDFGTPPRSAFIFPLWEQTEQKDSAVRRVSFYREGDCLSLGDGTIQVLETPGHSEGSVTLLWGETMLSGDTLFAGCCGRCDIESGSTRQMTESLRRLASLEGDYAVYPGHGPASTLSEERRSNHYMRQAMRL